MTEEMEKFHYYFLQTRGIENPCKGCGGYGVKTYGNSSTWSHGIGGQVMTSDVCDECWGSGDANEKWVDLHKLRLKIKGLKHLVFTYRTQCRAAMKAQSLGLCKRVIKHALDDDKEMNNDGS